MSGIYIPNAQIPQLGHRISVLSDGHAYYEDMANPYVDLGLVTPVPDHGRLGDLDALEDKCDDPHWCVWLSDIEDAPTVIPADKIGGQDE